MSFPCVRLEEVCDFLSGFAWSAGEFESEPTGLPIIRIQNVDAVRESDFVYWGGAYDERFVIRSGDILLTLSGSFRAEVWPGPDALLNQRIVKLTPKGAISPDWLLYVVRHKLAEIAGMGRHALVSNVALADLRALSVPLPPLPEQRRIAAILDKADALRTKRREALAQLDRLAQSIFVEMFGDPATNPKGWPVHPFVELGENQDSKRVPVKSSDRDGKQGQYPYYGASGIIDWVDDFIFDGDRLLIGEDGANLLARSTPIAFMARGKYWVNNHAHVIAANGKANLRYLEFFIEHIDLAPFISGSAQPKLNRSNLDRIPVMLPPMALQDEFTVRLKALHGLREKALQAQALESNLFASLQHRAFRGEL